MSSSPEILGYSGQRPVRLPEKPRSFSHTCSLLSQYLKKKGSFGDLSVGMKCNGSGTDGNSASRQTNTMDLFPRHPSFSSSAPQKDGLRTLDFFVNKSAQPEPQTAPLTIVYGGQVFVFNDVPGEKAEEIMFLAREGNRQIYTGITSNQTNATHIVSASSLAKNQPDQPRSLMPPTPNIIPYFTNGLSPEQIRACPASILYDIRIPIARRASLHRFLEKRRDRCSAREPYQINGPANPLVKPAARRSWLGLSSQ